MQLRLKFKLQLVGMPKGLAEAWISTAAIDARAARSYAVRTNL
jgi:hypothetical protein